MTKLSIDDILCYQGKGLENTVETRYYIAGMGYEEFLQDIKTQDAVVRNIEIIGEGVKNLSKSLRNNRYSVVRRYVGSRCSGFGVRIFFKSTEPKKTEYRNS